MAGKFDRFMVDVHIGINRKLRRLTVAERWCHVAGVLALAAQAPIRGRLLVGNEDATVEDYAELAGVSVSIARTTVEKLRAVEVIVRDDEHDCEMVHDWDEMNPEPKRDATGAERQQRYRDRRKERNGNGTVTDRDAVTVTQGREGKRNNEAKASSRRVTEPTTEDAANCRLLAELVIARDPDQKDAITRAREKWLREMRLLRQRDGRSNEKIEKAIRWSQSSSFWAPVIHSPKDLRKHFKTIWGQMQRPGPELKPVETSEEFLARRSA